MEYKTVRLAYRVVIDANSQLIWDQYVFEDTYSEYLMQQQLYNDKESPKNTFRELLAANENSEKLHYLVGIAADSYVRQLNGKLHRVTDVLGNNFFSFTNYQLDIINTDITDRSKHKIGLTFYSPLLTLAATINDCYLISKNLERTAGIETLMFAFQPKLAICYIEN